MYLPEVFPSSIFVYSSKSCSKFISFIDLSKSSKSTNFDASSQRNSLLLVDTLTESIPQSFTPLIMKGITVVFSFMLAAFPQAATIPFGFMCDKIFAKIFPPIVSTAPSYKPLSNGLESLSKSLDLITFFAPIDLS